ncbi:amidohydrolase family protein [Paenibacillus eucommiae]|uniref:TIM-barrel fold metal-dependent hydrolase n=1 Tax=Paenibacillus eucommiae TaxID=1355755 RepID=A0ABS4J1Z6_9BACL|nr:amidohydrolase family protein [Paenibacillus eucommiae]MBP1993859.1 putative TIM-barrel fold metal-dependent hydrolase [Paenibacillus eucommiae]
MKIYDANCMIGTYVREHVPIHGVEEFVQLASEIGIEKTLAYHADARSLNPVFGNVKLLDICRNHSFIEPCFVISPHYKYDKGWIFMEQLLMENDVRFVRLFPKEHGYTLTSVHVTEMLDIARKLNLNVMLSYNMIYQESGEENPYFEELCRRYRDVRFILTEAPHLRNMMWYSYLEQHPNVYVEMSTNDNWLTYEQTVRLFGSERLLLGSNMPFNHPGPSITMLAYADISETDKANISYKNLQRLMGRE